MAAWGSVIATLKGGNRLFRDLSQVQPIDLASFGLGECQEIICHLDETKGNSIDSLYSGFGQP